MWHTINALEGDDILHTLHETSLLTFTMTSKLQCVDFICYKV